MQYALIEITFDLNKIHVKLGIKSNVLNFTVLGNCEDFADYMTNLGISSMTAEDFRKEEATYQACLENKAKFDKLFDTQEQELLFDWLHENW